MKQKIFSGGVELLVRGDRAGYVLHMVLLSIAVDVPMQAFFRVIVATWCVFIAGVSDDLSPVTIHPYSGSGLPDVEASDDLFLQQEAMHPWLLDTWARFALNMHDLRAHGGHQALTHETIMGRREDERNTSRRRSGTSAPPCTPMTRGATARRGCDGGSPGRR